MSKSSNKKNQKPWWAVALCVILFCIAFWNQYGEDIRGFFQKSEDTTITTQADVSLIETQASTKPAETKPVATKPEETGPQETKPQETKPVETKPQETKPVETKPQETKPVETKPEETKPQETTARIDKNGTYTSKEEVALYISTYGKLPKNFIKKADAENKGWVASKGNLDKVCPGMSIGGDSFGNFEGVLPKAKGRKYYECDIDYEGGRRGSKRIVYSNDGLVYYTEDHYETFELLYGKE